MSEVKRLALECAALLDQARALLDRVSPDLYRASPTGTAEGSVGAHLRHCLDCYSCLFAGVENGRVDYDRRLRDGGVETLPERAAAVLESTARELRGAFSGRVDRELSIRMDEVVPASGGGWLRSSLARELRFLTSHTLHHFALIALGLAQQGVSVDPNFGVAPATAAFRRRAAQQKARSAKRAG